MSKVIKRKIVWYGKYLKAVEIYWKDGKSVVHKWEAVERTIGQNIVSVVAVTEKNEVLLVKEFRPPVNKEVIGLPAGLCDRESEDIETAARRELKEETGYTAAKFLKLFAGPVSPGLSSEFLTVFLAQGLKFTGKTETTEKIKLEKIPLNELEEWLVAQEEKGILADVKVRGFSSYVGKKIKQRGEGNEKK